jgi:tRNA(Ile)-lysidine synthase
MSPSKKSCEKDPFLKAVDDAIVRYGMLESGDRVLAAISGGPDSVALMHALRHCAERLALKIGIAHIHHGLRADADRDAEFIVTEAKRIGLPCYLERIDVLNLRKRRRHSPEEAARILRYQALERIAHQTQCRKIALGHHADDNAELVLMQLLRGSGPAGLAGMAPVRQQRYIRPLIHIRRTTILNFLHQHDLHYVHDPSNQDQRFTRNRIRHSLIPRLINDFNPNVVAGLNRLADIIRQEEQWLEPLVDSALKQAISAMTEEQITLDTVILRTNSRALNRRLIRRALAMCKGDLRRITMAHVDRIIALIASQAPTGQLHLPQALCVERMQNQLLVKQRARGSPRGHAGRAHDPVTPYDYNVNLAPDSETRIIITEIGAVLHFSVLARQSIGKRLDAGQAVAYFDMNRIEFPLTLRNIRPGDRFRPLGLMGSQKVKHYFINNKVPRHQRGRVPVLLSCDQIIWLVGHRIDERVRVRPGTKQVLRGIYFFGDRRFAMDPGAITPSQTGP